jgi:hypothetical protein
MATPPESEPLAALDPELLQSFEFIINEDGSVTFVDFPPELLDIAYALNPDDPLVCERRALLGDAPEESSGSGE